MDARRQSDENPNSSVVEETMKLLANSSYGYQTIDRNRHTVKKYVSDEKTHAAINSKLFKKLYHVNNALYETELAQAQIERKQLIIVRFFSLQNAKLRMLDLYYNFTKLCDVHKFEELEMDTDSLHLAVAERELENCIRPEIKSEWEQKIILIFSLLMKSETLSAESAVTSTKTMTSESLVYSKRNSGVRTCCVFAVKLTAATTKPLTS